MVDLRTGGCCPLGWLIILCPPGWMPTLSFRVVRRPPMKPKSMTRNPPLLSLYAVMYASSSRGLKVRSESDWTTGPCVLIYSTSASICALFFFHSPTLTPRSKGHRRWLTLMERYTRNSQSGSHDRSTQFFYLPASTFLTPRVKYLQQWMPRHQQQQ